MIESSQNQRLLIKFLNLWIELKLFFHYLPDIIIDVGNIGRAQIASYDFSRKEHVIKP